MRPSGPSTPRPPHLSLPLGTAMALALALALAFVANPHAAHSAGWTGPGKGGAPFSKIARVDGDREVHSAHAVPAAAAVSELF